MVLLEIILKYGKRSNFGDAYTGVLSYNFRRLKAD